MKKLLPMLILLVLLSACVPQTPAATVTNTPTTGFLPTATPKNLSPLYQLRMFTGGDGWATNIDKSHIYITPNFGESWMEVTPPQLAARDSDGGIFTVFANSQLAWICQSLPETPGVFYSTDDGGLNWSQVRLDFPCGPMGIASTQKGYILASEGVGAGSHYVSMHTTGDGGLTLTTTFLHEPAGADDHGLPTSGNKSQFVVLDANTLLVGGSIPVPGMLYLFRSEDEGASWTEIGCAGLPDQEDAEMAITNIIRINSNEVIAAIRAYPSDNDSIPTHFCASNDGGDSWRYLSSLDNVDFSDFGSIDTGVAFAEGKMYQTADGGLTWLDVSAGLPPAITPVGVDLVNAVFGYLTTSISPDTLDQNRIFMTVNNGASWQSIPGIIVE